MGEEVIEIVQNCTVRYRAIVYGSSLRGKPHTGGFIERSNHRISAYRRRTLLGGDVRHARSQGFKLVPKGRHRLAPAQTPRQRFAARKVGGRGARPCQGPGPRRPNRDLPRLQKVSLVLAVAHQAASAGDTYLCQGSPVSSARRLAIRRLIGFSPPLRRLTYPLLTPSSRAISTVPTLHAVI